MPGNGVATIERATIYERHARAVALRIQGKSLQVIADELGYGSPQSAWAAIKSEMDRTLPPVCDRLRQILTGRLESLYGKLSEELEADLARTKAAGKPISVKGLAMIDRMLRCTVEHGKLAGLQRQGEALESPQADDGEVVEPSAAKLKSREERLKELLERLTTRAANAAMPAVTEVVEHVPEGHTETPGHTL